MNKKWKKLIFQLLPRNWDFGRFFLTVALNPAQRKIYTELQVNERHGQHSRPLDFSITENEVRKAASKLKNSKSPFSDKITNEMINASLDTLMPVDDKLFNSILPLGTMPQTWYGGLITSIYKSGGA